MARFDPFWHAHQASQAEQKRAWFAAAFHRGQLAEHSPWDADAWTKLLAACDKLGHDRPAFAVCNRLLQRDPTLGPMYLPRARLQARNLNFWAAWADQMCSAYFGAIDHPDWTAFADAATDQGGDAATKEHWPEAVRQYTYASLWKPHDPKPLHNLAWAHLASGDTKGFRSTCRTLHGHFGNVEGKRPLFILAVMLGQGLQPLTPAPLVIDQAVQQDGAVRADAIARTATLLPDCGIPPNRLVTLAAREVAVKPSSSAYRETFGAALYRAGTWAEAVKQLEEARRLNGGSNWQHLFLAMAYHRLGNTKESDQAFARATLARDADWTQRLIYRRLRHEAETVRKSTPKPGK